MCSGSYAGYLVKQINTSNFNPIEFDAFRNIHGSESHRTQREKSTEMTGAHLRKKIRAKGFTFQQIADAIGESKQNFSRILSTDNIKTKTLERIAAAMGESVSYFYNERPIFTLAEYTEYESRKRENELLRQIIRDKEALISELTKDR